MHVPAPCLRRPLRSLSGLLLAIVLPVTQSLACSTVAFPGPDAPLLAYNFDFAETGAGYLTVNSEGAQRQSVMEGTPARWAARHGSVTVNQIGPGMPTAGMNRAGLVVTLMWNENAVYGGGGTAPLVSELEFIQYLLDTAGSVEEAFAAVGDVRIQGLVPIHYFLFDRNGRTAVLTPTAQGLEVHTGNSLLVPALTNTGYEKALGHLQRYRGFGGEAPVPERQRPGKTNSLDRFVIAAEATRGAGAEFASSDAFAVLNRLSNAETRWQLVFEPEASTMRLRLADGTGILVLDLQRMPHACQMPPRAADLRQITPDLKLEDLPPLEPAALAVSLAEVFSSMSQTAHLGRPEIVDGIAAGLIHAASCKPE